MNESVEPRPATSAPPAAVSPEQHAEATTQLARSCLEVRLSIGRLPTERAIRGLQADVVAQSVRGTKAGIRSKWALFRGDHPQVKELNTAIRVLELFVQRNTIPKGNLVGGSDADKVANDPGVRYVWADQAEAFYAGVCDLAGLVDAAASAVESRMEDIKANDRKAAGDAWREECYPEDLRKTVGVQKDAAGRYVVNFAPAPDFDAMKSAELAKLSRRWFEERMSSTIQASVDGFAAMFNETLSGLIQSLNNRMQINPPQSHPWHERYCRFGAAEVLSTKSHKDDAAITAGHVKVYLQYREEDGETGETRTVRAWTPEILETAYVADVRPQGTADTRRLSNSVMERVIDEIAAFKRNKAPMLGAYGLNVERAFAGLDSMITGLRGANDTSESLAKRVLGNAKSSEDYAERLRSELAATVDYLDQNVEVVRKSRRNLAFGLKDAA